MTAHLATVAPPLPGRATMLPPPHASEVYRAAVSAAEALRLFAITLAARHATVERPPVARRPANPS